MKIYKWLDRLYDAVSGHFTGWLLVFMMCLVLVEVITRYVVRRPFGAATELSGFLLVIITFMGLAYAWKDGGHIRLTFVIAKLPARLAKMIRLIILAITLAFMVLLIKSYYDRVAFSLRLGLKSLDLGLDLAWFQLFMLIGIILLFFWVLIVFIRAIKSYRSETGENI